MRLTIEGQGGGAMPEDYTPPTEAELEEITRWILNERAWPSVGHGSLEAKRARVDIIPWLIRALREARAEILRDGLNWQTVADSKNARIAALESELAETRARAERAILAEIEAADRVQALEAEKARLLKALRQLFSEIPDPTSVPQWARDDWRWAAKRARQFVAGVIDAAKEQV